MTYEEFMKRVKEEIQERVTGDVVIVNPDKNNGIKLYGISIHDENNEVAPVVYLKEFYSKFESGRDSLESIVGQILKASREASAAVNFDIGAVMDFERVKNKIVYKLINTERNRELLKDVPHTEILNLSKVYQVWLGEMYYGLATILIHNHFLDLWGITAAQLESIAEENAPKLLPMEFIPMMELLDIMVLEQIGETDLMDEIPELPDTRMYVLTNSQRQNGAAVICYKGILEYVADFMKGNFYILPSSLHEVIILPEIEGRDIKRVCGMVREINEYAVPMEAVLSDNVYHYNRETKAVIVITE